MPNAGLLKVCLLVPVTVVCSELLTATSDHHVQPRCVQAGWCLAGGLGLWCSGSFMAWCVVLASWHGVWCWLHGSVCGVGFVAAPAGVGLAQRG